MLLRTEIVIAFCLFHIVPVQPNHLFLFTAPPLLSKHTLPVCSPSACMRVRTCDFEYVNIDSSFLGLEIDTLLHFIPLINRRS